MATGYTFLSRYTSGCWQYEHSERTRQKAGQDEV